MLHVICTALQWSPIAQHLLQRNCCPASSFGIVKHDRPVAKPREVQHLQTAC